MKIFGKDIHGAVDKQTRCRHYHGPSDRIAIKFYCCGEYFPCYQCHQEFGCGKPKVWPRRLYDEQAVLCGSCGSELPINGYLNSGNRCLACDASFNPGCAMHYHLYFSKE